MMKIDSKRELPMPPMPISIKSGMERYLENRASAERLCKGTDFHIVEGVQRVCAPVLALHRSGDIDGCHVSAADRWYRDYVLGVEGARDGEAGRSGQAADAHAGMLSRVAACARHRAIREALGFCSQVRLKLLLVDELSFSAMAARLMPQDVNGRKKIAAQTVFLLEQLAEHYQMLDERSRQRRTPPRKC